MDGLNGEFRGNPIDFMGSHILHPNPGWSNDGGTLDQRDLQTGIHSFDILKPHGTAALYRLKFWERGALCLHKTTVPEGTFNRVTVAAHQPTLVERFKGFMTDPHYNEDPSPRRSNEGPIRAYWLPFRMNRTYEMDLGQTQTTFSQPDSAVAPWWWRAIPQHPTWLISTA